MTCGEQHPTSALSGSIKREWSAGRPAPEDMLTRSARADASPRADRFLIRGRWLTELAC
jgi:hypothetical protein